jgi:hypothetical protein
MSERSWPRPALATTALATTALALLGVAAVAGCSTSAASSQAASSQAASSQASSSQASSSQAATPQAGEAAATGANAYAAAELKDALLTKINGTKPASAAEAGDYGTLPDVRTSKQTMNGVKVTPARCAAATVTGFNSASFADAPASVVTFRIGSDGVSEVLVSASSKLAATALGNKLPAGCSHYKATVDGKTFSYSVREAKASGIGDQARALNVKAAGYAEVDVWSVVFRGSGFVGAVTMVGPNATSAGVKQLAADAYSDAAQSLS